MLGKWYLKGFCRQTIVQLSRSSFVSPLSLKQSKMAILAMFRGKNYQKKVMCPIFAPLFLNQ